jgi:hypothetical protein
VSQEAQQELRLAEEAEQVLKRLQARGIQRKKVGSSRLASVIESRQGNLIMT